MSLAATRASSLTRTSPRSHFAKFELKTSRVFAAHSRDTGFHGVPVGRTQRNGSTNASSTGPCSPWILRRLVEGPASCFAPAGSRRSLGDGGDARVHADPVFTND